MVNLERVPQIAILMVLIAAIFVSGFLVLDGLDNNQECADGRIINISNSAPCQASGDVSDTDEYTSVYNATADMNEGLINIVDYAPTWGTIIGVAVLLAIVMGGLAAGFLFGRKRNMF